MSESKPKIDSIIENQLDLAKNIVKSRLKAILEPNDPNVEIIHASEGNAFKLLLIARTTPPSLVAEVKSDPKILKMQHHSSKHLHTKSIKYSRRADRWKWNEKRAVPHERAGPSILFQVYWEEEFMNSQTQIDVNFANRVIAALNRIHDDLKKSNLLFGTEKKRVKQASTEKNGHNDQSMGKTGNQEVLQESTQEKIESQEEIVQGAIQEKIESQEETDQGAIQEKIIDKKETINKDEL